MTGVDFSRVAVDRATAAADAAGLADRARFLVADVTGGRVDGADGPFDLAVAYNTLQDLRGEDRRRMARLLGRLCRPGGKAVIWCYFRPVASLRLVSFRGPSRLAPFVVEPGEERALFGEDFDIERLAQPAEGSGFACFLMTRY